jgi:2-polyprenyl-3-methyl-5-hydroxy-6-metoxy-1,4-benzoquinol methylase
MSVSCVVCQGEVKVIREFFRDDEQVISLRSCNSCHAEMLLPQPNNRLLSAQYQDYFKKRTGAGRRIKVPYFRKFLSGLDFNFADKKILEIGGGEGDCAGAMMELFPTARLTVVEANSENQDFFKGIKCEMINQSVEDFLETASKNPAMKYDYIILFDVIEHFRSPIDVVAQLSKLLHVGGRIVATFPNCEAASRRAMGPVWFQYKLEHLTYFSKESVGVMAEKNQLQVETIQPLYKQLPIDYLLTIGKNFGPPLFQSTVRAISPLVPKMISSKSAKLGLGEWLAVLKS